MLHHFSQRRVCLPHDLIKPRCLDPRFLELLIGSACFDRLMLARVAYKQNPVATFESVQKFVHLPSTCEARFVENVESLLAIVQIFAPRQMPLQRARFDSRFFEFLRRAGCWREAFDLITLALGGFADYS